MTLKEEPDLTLYQIRFCFCGASYNKLIQCYSLIQCNTCYSNVYSRPGENFGSHRGRFFCFSQRLTNRVAAVQRTVLPRMLHPHGAWGRQPQLFVAPYGYQ